MQNVINTVKGTALGVAEFLTPVLKVGDWVQGSSVASEVQIVKARGGEEVRRRDPREPLHEPSVLLLLVFHRSQSSKRRG